MKAVFNKFIFPRAVIAVAVFFCFNSSVSAQQKMPQTKITMEPFTITVLNTDFSMVSGTQIILNEKEVKVLGKDFAGEGHDSLLFIKKIEPDDDMKAICETDLSSLEDYYSNPCIMDGLQVTVGIKIRSRSKIVHFSNYYQEDAAKIISYVNTLVPEKYKIWYEKEKLVKGYEECGERKER